LPIIPGNLPGGLLHATRTGIGPALRKARLHRGKSLEEASRETRIRVASLDALERESFDVLAGDVYVRGFLRTYSSYLGLRPEKVVSVYERRFGSPPPSTVAVPDQPGVDEALSRPPASDDRGRWRLALASTAVLLGVAGALGLLSRAGGGPAPVETPSTTRAVVAPASPGVSVAVVALDDVTVTVVEDGQEAFSGLLHDGEGRAFDATERIDIEFSRGGAVELTVNGHEVGIPGLPVDPYRDSFGPDDFRDAAAGTEP
jgi:hypothetical protein